MITCFDFSESLYISQEGAFSISIFGNTGSPTFGGSSSKACEYKAKNLPVFVHGEEFAKSKPISLKVIIDGWTALYNSSSEMWDSPGVICAISSKATTIEALPRMVLEFLAKASILNDANALSAFTRLSLR